MVIPHIRWLMGWIRGQPGLLSLHSTPLPLIEKLTFARIVIQDMMLIIVPGWLYIYYYCWWGVVMFIHEWQCCCVNTARLSYGNTTLVSLKQLPPESLHGCWCPAHTRPPDNVYSLPPGKVNVGLHLHLGHLADAFIQSEVFNLLACCRALQKTLLSAWGFSAQKTDFI